MVALIGISVGNVNMFMLLIHHQTMNEEEAMSYFGFAKCVDIPIGQCPNGLDDDDDEDDYYDYDEDCTDEY